MLTQFIFLAIAQGRDYYYPYFSNREKLTFTVSTVSKWKRLLVVESLLLTICAVKIISPILSIKKRRAKIIKLSKIVTKHDPRTRIQWFFERIELSRCLQILKSYPGNPGNPQILSGSQRDQRHFPFNIKTYLPFCSSVIRVQLNFSETAWHCNSLNAGDRIITSPMKPDIKAIYKKVQHNVTLLTNIFVLVKI